VDVERVRREITQEGRMEESEICIKDGQRRRKRRRIISMDIESYKAKAGELRVC
jgi:hypothetical protein